MAEDYVTTGECKLRGELYNEKLRSLDCEIEGIKEQQRGIREDIKGVRDLQVTILYAIIGLAGASVLTLVGVVAGRAIDFGVFFP